MTLYLALTIVGLLAAGLVLVGLLADRSARENAWRRIAEERRWNSDHRRSR